jgi:hypothetical protein
MVHKFQNIHGISYVVSSESQKNQNDLQDLVKKIIEDKKFPFTDVYVKLPVFMFQKFMEFVRNSDLRHKEMESRKDIFLIKF